MRSNNGHEELERYGRENLYRVFSVLDSAIGAAGWRLEYGRLLDFSFINFFYRSDETKGQTWSVTEWIQDWLMPLGDVQAVFAARFLDMTLCSAILEQLESVGLVGGTSCEEFLLKAYVSGKAKA